jgi:hypothetical protein
MPVEVFSIVNDNTLISNPGSATSNQVRAQEHGISLVTLCRAEQFLADETAAARGGTSATASST